MMVQGLEIAVAPTLPTLFCVFGGVPFAILSNQLFFKSRCGQALNFFEHLRLVNDASRTRKPCGTNAPRTFLEFLAMFLWGTVCGI